jgi:hypothetical protein
VDLYSSAAYFDGWRERLRLPLLDDGEPAVVPPRIWLLTTGWRRRGGPISVDEQPRRGRD